MTTAFCAIPTPRLVYASPATKEEFDRLQIQETVHDWLPCRTTALVKNDEQQWERRCHSKTLGDFGDGVTVIFQWFDERVSGEGGGE